MTDYVSFPRLGWTFPLPETCVEFDLFGLTVSIKWYAVMIVLGILLAALYGCLNYKRFGLDADRTFDVVLVAALCGFVGARLYYVLFSEHRAAYFADPVSILYVWQGGLGIYGGIIFAVLAAWLMCRIRKEDTLALFDLGGLGLLIGQGVGRWGNFFNQEAFGGNTTLPWGMTGSQIIAGVNGSGYHTDLPVHPTFFYEFVWCILGFVILHIVSIKCYCFKGQIFALYLIWYGAGRFFIEGLRTDSLLLGQLRVSQLVAVIAVVIGVVMLIWLSAKRHTTGKDLSAIATDGFSTLGIAGHDDATVREEDGTVAEYEEHAEDTLEYRDDDDANDTEEHEEEPEYGD